MPRKVPVSNNAAETVAAAAWEAAGLDFPVAALRAGAVAIRAAEVIPEAEDIRVVAEEDIRMIAAVILTIGVAVIPAVGAERLP